ncbi:MAG: hypothetical protein LBU74_02125 [Methanobacteriaceae archaeon]|jgi:hypothetical protein|nr:hypothetical protein [Candidatus Methanorudis spinitermitis]
MNQKTLNLMKKAISTAGKWIWMEIAHDSIQLEFDNVQIYNPRLNESKSHSSMITIRLANNAFFKLFYNDNNEKFEKNFLNPIYDFSYNLNNKSFKFQDFKLLEAIKNNFKYQKVLLGNSKNNIKNGDIDFLLCFIAEKIAIATGGNQIQFFNEFNLLNDDEIKRLSNKWWVYWVDYWKKENTLYEYDSACEIYPLEIAKKLK